MSDAPRDLGLTAETAQHVVDERSTTDDPDELELSKIQDLIVRDYPSVPVEHIADLLRSCYEQTQDASVQNFRLLLAEHATRERMHSDGYVYRRS